MDLASGNQTWQWKIPHAWRFFQRHITKINGPLSSQNQKFDYSHGFRRRNPPFPHGFPRDFALGRWPPRTASPRLVSWAVSRGSCWVASGPLGRHPWGSHKGPMGMDGMGMLWDKMLWYFLGRKIAETDLDGYFSGNWCWYLKLFEDIMWYPWHLLVTSVFAMEINSLVNREASWNGPFPSHSMAMWNDQRAINHHSQFKRFRTPESLRPTYVGDIKYTIHHQTAKLVYRLIDTWDMNSKEFNEVNRMFLPIGSPCCVHSRHRLVQLVLWQPPIWPKRRTKTCSQSGPTPSVSGIGLENQTSR